MTGPSHLCIEGIGKAFGSTSVLDDVSLEIARGEFVALVGPSGCGKSTLLRIIAGLERPDAGSIRLDGRDVTGLRAAERDVAMVFQSYALYPHLTARQNLMVPLSMRHLTSTQRLPFVGRFVGNARARLAEMARDVEGVAETLRITPLLDRKPGQMSGGQRQRVALGRALVRRPQAFLMDEPLSNLDASLRVHTRGEIVDLHRRIGGTTVYVTHDQEEALSMADRVAVMLGGRLLQVADPLTIYRDPDHLEVACFIGSPRINLLAGEVRGGIALVAGARLAAGLAVADGTAVTVGFRPEAGTLARQQSSESLPAIVERCEFHGSEAMAFLRHRDEPLAVRVEPDEVSRLRPGDTLHVAIRESLVFDGSGHRLRPAVDQLAPMGLPRIGLIARV